MNNETAYKRSKGTVNESWILSNLRYFATTHFWVKFKGLGTVLNGWCWVKSHKILF